MGKEEEREESPSKIGKLIRDVVSELTQEQLEKIRAMTPEKKKEFLEIYKKLTGRDFPDPID